MLALIWPLAFEGTTFAFKWPAPDDEAIFLGLPVYHLDQPCKDKSLYNSMERAKLMGMKPDKQEDVEKIILFWPQCTLWIR